MEISAPSTPRLLPSALVNAQEKHAQAKMSIPKEERETLIKNLDDWAKDSGDNFEACKKVAAVFTQDDALLFPTPLFVGDARLVLDFQYLDPRALEILPEKIGNYFLEITLGACREGENGMRVALPEGMSLISKWLIHDGLRHISAPKFVGPILDLGACTQLQTVDLPGISEHTGTNKIQLTLPLGVMPGQCFDCRSAEDLLKHLKHFAERVQWLTRDSEGNIAQADFGNVTKLHFPYKGQTHLKEMHLKDPMMKPLKEGAMDKGKRTLEKAIALLHEGKVDAAISALFVSKDKSPGHIGGRNGVVALFQLGLGTLGSIPSKYIVAFLSQCLEKYRNKPDWPQNFLSELMKIHHETVQVSSPGHVAEYLRCAFALNSEGLLTTDELKTCIGFERNKERYFQCCKDDETLKMSLLQLGLPAPGTIPSKYMAMLLSKCKEMCQHESTWPQNFIPRLAEIGNINTLSGSDVVAHLHCAFVLHSLGAITTDELKTRIGFEQNESLYFMRCQHDDALKTRLQQINSINTNKLIDLLRDGKILKALQVVRRNTPENVVAALENRLADFWPSVPGDIIGTFLMECHKLHHTQWPKNVLPKLIAKQATDVLKAPDKALKAYLGCAFKLTFEGPIATHTLINCIRFDTHKETYAKCCIGDKELTESLQKLLSLATLIRHLSAGSPEAAVGLLHNSDDQSIGPSVVIDAMKALLRHGFPEVWVTGKNLGLFISKCINNTKGSELRNQFLDLIRIEPIKAPQSPDSAVLENQLHCILFLKEQKHYKDHEIIDCISFMENKQHYFQLCSGEPELMASLKLLDTVANAGISTVVGAAGTAAGLARRTSRLITSGQFWKKPEERPPEKEKK
jgi:hypothetical protein